MSALERQLTELRRLWHEQAWTTLLRKAEELAKSAHEAIGLALEREGAKVLADGWEAQAKAFEHQLAELRRELRWVGQAVHQAHHEGPIDECRKNTCDAVRQALARRRA